MEKWERWVIVAIHFCFSFHKWLLKSGFVISFLFSMYLNFHEEAFSIIFSATGRSWQPYKKKQWLSPTDAQSSKEINYLATFLLLCFDKIEFQMWTLIFTIYSSSSNSLALEPFIEKLEMFNILDIKWKKCIHNCCFAFSKTVFIFMQYYTIHMLK